MARMQPPDLSASLILNNVNVALGQTTGRPVAPTRPIVTLPGRTAVPQYVPPTVQESQWGIAPSGAVCVPAPASGGIPPPGYVCKICQIPGHYIRDCVQYSTNPADFAPTPGVVNTPPPGYVCKICNQPGHYIRDCAQYHQTDPNDPKGKGKGKNHHGIPVAAQPDMAVVDQETFNYLNTAFEYLMNHHDPEASGQSRIYTVRNFIKAADEECGEDTETKKALTMEWCKHPWMVENEQIVHYRWQRNIIGVKKINHNQTNWAEVEEAKRQKREQWAGGTTIKYMGPKMEGGGAPPGTSPDELDDW